MNQDTQLASWGLRLLQRGRELEGAGLFWQAGNTYQSALWTLWFAGMYCEPVYMETLLAVDLAFERSSTQEKSMEGERRRLMCALEAYEVMSDYRKCRSLANDEEIDLKLRIRLISALK